MGIISSTWQQSCSRPCFGEGPNVSLWVMLANDAETKQGISAFLKHFILSIEVTARSRGS
jgi:hypothetical protein